MVGVWLSPVVLATLAARVVAGEPGAPLFVALIASAGLIGVLAARRADPDARAEPVSRGTGLAALPLLASLVLVLAANLVVLGDAARALGGTRALGLAAAAALALGVGWTAADRGWRLVAPIGVAIVLVPLALALATAGTPWTTWQALASRSALTFGAASAWVTRGHTLGPHATLRFQEPHRVTAAGPATWRVVEHDATRVTVREWRLGAGDALTLRPGDELAIDAPARVRFQAGRRVPGTPPSGVAWADGEHRSAWKTVVRASGVALTLIGGVALTPAVHAAGVSMLVPLVLLTFVVGAALWGLYAVALAPEVALLPHTLAPLLEVVARTAPPRWRQAVVVLVAAGLVALFLGMVVAWRARLAGAIAEVAAALRGSALSGPTVTIGTAGVVALALLVAWRVDDAWRLFAWGLGLAAAAVLAPRVALAGPRGTLAGAATGTLVFAALALGVDGLPVPVGALTEYPAAIAAPAAWLAARLARGR